MLPWLLHRTNEVMCLRHRQRAACSRWPWHVVRLLSVRRHPSHVGQCAGAVPGVVRSGALQKFIGQRKGSSGDWVCCRWRPPMRPLRPLSAMGLLPPPSRIRPLFACALAAHIRSVCITDLVGHDLTDHEPQDCCVRAEENVRIKY